VAKPQYKRILLKLSGEALQGDKTGVHFPTVGSICDEIVEIANLGVEVGVVVGGGNIFRGATGANVGLDKPTGDYMGMLATMINALALQAAIEARGVPSRVLTAIEMRPVAEPYIRRRAMRH